MSGYTVKNLMDLEDRAKDQGSAVEARLGRPHIDSEHLGAWPRTPCERSRPVPMGWS